MWVYNDWYSWHCLVCKWRFLEFLGQIVIIYFWFVTYKSNVQQRKIDVERKIYGKYLKRDRKGGLLVETHDSTMIQCLNALYPLDPS